MAAGNQLKTMVSRAHNTFDCHTEVKKKSYVALLASKKSQLAAYETTIDNKISPI